MKQYIEVCVSEGHVLSITCPDAQCEKQGELQNMEVGLIPGVGGVLWDEGNVLSITCPDAQCEKQGELQNMEVGLIPGGMCCGVRVMCCLSRARMHSVRNKENYRTWR